MKTVTSVGIVLAAALVAIVAGDPGPAPPTAPQFGAYHYRSDVEGTQFREVFWIHDVALPSPPSPFDVEIRRDGSPLDVAWEDADGILSSGDRFSFVQEAFDVKQLLTGHYQGSQAMECRFGGGAALGISPPEWIEMGLPGEVRCLRFLDDQ